MAAVKIPWPSVPRPLLRSRCGVRVASRFVGVVGNRLHNIDSGYLEAAGPRGPHGIAYPLCARIVFHAS